MDYEAIIDELKSCSSNSIKFAVADIDGILRGKMISKSKFLKSLKNGISFCDILFGWDSADSVYDNAEVTGWHTAYPDDRVSIDASTFREIPWDDDTPLFLADLSDSDHLSEVCPRSLLKAIRKQCLDAGFKAVFSEELEWFNFKKSRDSGEANGHRNSSPITPGMFGYSMLRPTQNSAYFHALFDGMNDIDVPLEALHTETGPGVYEASISHTDILEAADRAVLFKTGVKQIADNFDMSASFMAKWNAELPGCGGHFHQSLLDADEEKEIFFYESGDHHISQIMEQYIAGQLHCLPYILPMYAPTINSYKRLVEGSWAATSVSWGVDNRTTALRVINKSKSEMRVEMRVPGADVNPYLGMAASLASGLYGIKNEMSLDIRPTSGNEYENEGSKQLSKTLPDAVSVMKSSEIAQKLFGEAFTDHFIKTREWECRQYSKAVTDWELERYFEII